MILYEELKKNEIGERLDLKMFFPYLINDMSYKNFTNLTYIKLKEERPSSKLLFLINT